MVTGWRPSRKALGMWNFWASTKLARLGTPLSRGIALIQLRYLGHRVWTYISEYLKPLRWTQSQGYTQGHWIRPRFRISRKHLSQAPNFYRKGKIELLGSCRSKTIHEWKGHSIPLYLVAHSEQTVKISFLSMISSEFYLQPLVDARHQYQNAHVLIDKRTSSILAIRSLTQSISIVESS